MFLCCAFAGTRDPVEFVGQVAVEAPAPESKERHLPPPLDLSGPAVQEGKLLSPAVTPTEQPQVSDRVLNTEDLEVPRLLGHALMSQGPAVTSEADFLPSASEDEGSKKFSGLKGIPEESSATPTHQSPKRGLSRALSRGASRILNPEGNAPVPQREDKPSFRRDASGAVSLPSSLGSELNPHRGLRRQESVLSSSLGLADVYTTMRKLGQGAYGSVWLVRHKKTKNMFACKSIPLPNIGDSSRFEMELSIARKLKHPHIIRLHEYIRDSQNYHLIMELCSGGDLLERIRHYQDDVIGGEVGMPSKVVGCYLWQMLAGLAYLHHYKFAHRDIKPENYLLYSRSEDAPIKLGDFGLARVVNGKELMMSKVGTPHYVAPEVLEGVGYDTRCDVWSAGVVAHVMAVSRVPFKGATERELFHTIRTGHLDLNGPGWGWQPVELKELVGQMMQRNPKDRPSAKRLLANSAWLRRHAYKEGGCFGCC